MLSYIEKTIGPSLGTEANTSVIWLHGLGADGNDFVPILNLLNISESRSIRFIFPHAPQRPVTLNNGMAMPAWFDIYSLEENAQQDEAGIFSAMREIEVLIENEMRRGIPLERIFIAGFSQGGAVALHLLLHGSHQIGGIIALSTYLPLHTLIEKANIARIPQIPIFLAHGVGDEVLPLHYAQLSHDRLLQHGANIDFYEYSMGHQVNNQELNDLCLWLEKQLSE